MACVCEGKAISTRGGHPTHLIQRAQARDMGGVCQGHLLHVHGLILPHGLLHKALHCPELLWGQWSLAGSGGKGLINRQSAPPCLQLMHSEALPVH